MLERIFKNPVSTLAGVFAGVFQYIQFSPNGFTWEGFFTILPTLLIGALSKDGKK